ncbi:hypothetical protein COU17_01885 [Candidatus Kaiserbacteria bacterium CG10_big_fil_rev_8_21_14_0_10_49_17]|uniref:ComEC/Rec2-related protein domain-containing protein n=1 Tax=Candidatus Kaiserbacteria bacterium CG10_big_fil_rev_8_21_14_0_10_49_17 TaxID=1974609 RepID=A0A2M6WEK2_9BACT|nr:MAG: hypothetical protein COU17_01885 [Candidatus Kaiserbacteria bacterium CG10_big_fil_rev_8_21_14_0_10_49_17]
MKSNFLYVLVFGFGAGVCARSVFDFGFSFSVFLALLGAVVLLLSVIYKERRVILIGLVLITAGLGVLRMDAAERYRLPAVLQERVGESVTVSGVIIDEPDERESNTKLLIRVSEYEGEELREKVLVVAPVYPRFSYGDVISVTGELSNPAGFLGDDGDYFDYARYLAKDDIYYQILFPTITLLERGNGNPIKRILFAVKRSLLESISKMIPEPHSSLLGGLVVGAKRSLGEQLLEDFRATGIIHIVVLSGYNVTIVAEFIMRVLAFLPTLISLSVGAVSIVLFAILTGASATIVRASIMAILVLLARATGRTYAITRALFLAGFLMVLENPKILLSDASFQLSFLATLGLIHLAPQLEKYFGWVPSTFQLREFATATVSTQIFVLPLLLYLVGEFSIVALPVNLLILVFIPLTMLLGFITGVIGLVIPLLAIPFAYATYGLLSYQLLVVELFAKLPFASVEIHSFPLWAMLLTYVLYGLLFWRVRQKATHSSE